MQSILCGKPLIGSFLLLSGEIVFILNMNPVTVVPDEDIRKSSQNRIGDPHSARPRW